MFEKYHQKKLQEYAAAHAEKLVTDSEQSQAVIDYNMMMGKLDDPEQEVNGDE